MESDDRPISEEISAFAERVLFSACLEDKLQAPLKFTDLKAYREPLGAIPRAPARHAGLTLISSGQNRRAKKELRPHAEHLADPHLRGRLLHTFAHHELISLELMALALLRFPQAPRAFRRGLAQVITDEQRHFKLYRDRVQALGIDFGSEPVSDYFWRCVAHAPTLEEFNARLGLVFEQANIDFTRHYAPLMRAVGDEESAAALDVIYHDEISHVGFGLHWFRRWRPQNEPEWDSFCALLRPPLSPGRAKGAVFCIEGRRAVGMSEAFISQLKRWGGSTGRPPHIWWGNLDVEEEWRDWAVEHASTSGVGPNSLDKIELSARGRSKRRKTRRHARRGFTPLLGWLCTRGDVIISPDGEPSEPFQEHLYQARGFNPQWLTSPEEVSDLKLGAVTPWGWSPQSVATFEHLKDRLIPSALPMQDQASMTELAPLFTKAWDLEARDEVRRALIDHAEPCPFYFPDQSHTHYLRTSEDLERFLRIRASHPIARWVVKAAWGNAGRGLLLLHKDRPISEPERGWLKRQLSWGLLVEPWVQRCADLSFQGVVDRDGARYEGAVVGLVDHLGRFQGAELSPPQAALDVTLKRFVNGDGRDRGRLKRLGTLIIQTVGRLLAQRKFSGHFGVDALICERRDGSSTQLMIYPVVEVNPRYTMGHLTLSLRKRLDPQGRRAARVTFYPPNISNAWLMQKLKDEPLHWDAQGQWRSGVIPLSDVWRERDLDSSSPSALMYGPGPVVLLEPQR